MGSGSNVDLCVITKDNIDYLRNEDKPVGAGERANKSYKYQRGITEVLSTTVKHFDVTSSSTVTNAMEVEA